MLDVSSSPGYDLPEQEEEKNSGDNHNSQKDPSSPVLKTGPTVVLVSVLIHTTAGSREPSGSQCAHMGITAYMLLLLLLLLLTNCLGRTAMSYEVE